MDFCFLLKTWVKVSVINMVINFVIVLKTSTTDAIKTASKGAIQKRAKATGDLIGNKIVDKITSISKKPSCNNNNNNNNNEDVEIIAHKKRNISPEERQQIIDELMLTLKRYIYLKEKQQIIDKLKVTTIV